MIIQVLFTIIPFSWRGYDVFAEWRFRGVEFKFLCEQKKWKEESVLLVGYFNPWTQLSLPLYNYQSATTKRRICSTGWLFKVTLSCFYSVNITKHLYSDNRLQYLQCLLNGASHVCQANPIKVIFFSINRWFKNMYRLQILLLKILTPFHLYFDDVVWSFIRIDLNWD